MTETLFELERATNREDLAALLAELSEALEDDRPAVLGSGERTVEIDVPGRTTLEIELERAGEPPTVELEFELEWDDRPEDSTVRVVETDAETAVGSEDPEIAAESEEAAATLQEELEAEAVDEQLVDRSDGSAAVTDDEPTEGSAGTNDRDSSEGSAAEDRPAADPAVDEESGEELPADEEPQRSTPSPASSVAPPDAVAESDAVTDEGETDGRRSRFEVYRDRAGEWRWRLVHWNGNVIADSGEGYASRRNAERGLRSVMRNAPEAGIDRLE